MTVEQGAHMEVASLLERQPDCSSEDALGAPPFSTKRVASLGDMVNGTTSRFPGELPGGVLRWEGAEARRPVLACVMTGLAHLQRTIYSQASLDVRACGLGDWSAPSHRLSARALCQG